MMKNMTTYLHAYSSGQMHRMISKLENDGWTYIKHDYSCNCHEFTKGEQIAYVMMEY